MAKGKASLRELMGKAADKSNLSVRDLPDILGDGMPQLDMSPVGRIRLIRALKQRFGDNFRSLPGLKGIVSEFDKMANAEVTKQRLKQIKFRGGRG